MDRGVSSPMRRRIPPLGTSAWTAAERKNPRISAHRISQNIPNANDSARPTLCVTVATGTRSAAKRNTGRLALQIGEVRAPPERDGWNVSGDLGFHDARFAQPHESSPAVIEARSSDLVVPRRTATASIAAATLLMVLK